MEDLLPLALLPRTLGHNLEPQDDIFAVDSEQLSMMLFTRNRRIINQMRRVIHGIQKPHWIEM